MRRPACVIAVIAIAYVLISAPAGNALPTPVVYNDYIITSSKGLGGISGRGNAVINMYSGDLTYDSGLVDNARFNLFGGTVDSLGLRNSSNAVVFGGSIDLLVLRDQSTADIHGGQVAALGCSAESIAFLHAYDVVFDPYGGKYGSGLVKGRYLLDDSPVTINLVGITSSPETFDHIHIVPEPATVLLMLSAGILTLRSRKRRNR